MIGEFSDTRLEQLRHLLDHIPQMVWSALPDGAWDYCNQQWLTYTGLSLEQVCGTGWQQAVHRDDLPAILAAWRKAVDGGTPAEIEARLCNAEGSYRRFLARIVPNFDQQGRVSKWYGTFTDIEDRKRGEDLLQGEHTVLEMIAAGGALPVVLTALTRLIEAQCAGLLCSILLLDEDGVHLRHGAAPSLPESYIKAIDGSKIGPKVGSCGTAAFRREPVIVTDLLTDPLWEDYRELAAPLGLRASWSMPILSHSGEVLGTFGMYYREVRSPSAAENRLIEIAARIAGIAIDRHHSTQRLKRSEAYLAEGQRLTHLGSWAWDAISHENIYWSQEHFRIFEMDPATDQPDYHAAIRMVHPDDLGPFIEAVEKAIENKRDFEVDWRIVFPDGRVKHLRSVGHPVLNEAGNVAEMLGTCMDVTEQHLARETLEKALEEIRGLQNQLYKENLALRDEVDRASMFEEIVGTSPALQVVLQRVARVGPTDSTVLITGETGTGKELIARALHKGSQRAGRAFVSINCAALPQALIPSELFGHEKGAFTGATQRRLGRFELADGGTIFLDEVGELPADTQVALLRVLQERQFERVGGTQSISVDVRVIAATNRDLQAAVEAGSFRLDLFYRLNVFPIDVPPLRQRKEDILILLEYFVGRYARMAGKQISKVDRRTLELFQSYEWPGNIRELQNVIERSVILCTGDVFSVDGAWLGRQPAGGVVTSRTSRLNEKLSHQEKEIIEAALAESGGRVAGASGAAAKLGVPPSTLESKIRTLQIRKHQFRK